MLIEFEVHGKTEGDIVDAAIEQTRKFFDRTELWELDARIVECSATDYMTTYSGDHTPIRWEARVVAGLKHQIEKRFNA